METIGKITVFIIFIVLIILSSLFGAYVILKIATMYNLQFITQFTFLQVIGIMCIITLLTHPLKKAEPKIEATDFKEAIKAGFIMLVNITSSYLGIWLSAYLYFLLLR